MPQLAKGGKYVFGWARVGATGSVRVPPEAAREYGLLDETEAVLVSGSRTSGGFVLMRPSLIEASPLGAPLRRCPGLAAAESEGTLKEWNNRLYTRVTLHGASFHLPAVGDLPAGEGPYGYGLRPGDLLLVVRGSYVGPSFLSRGPLVAAAHGYNGLDVFG